VVHGPRPFPNSSPTSSNMTHYDDPRFSYPKYWLSRQYEHQSEVTAISKLLKSLRFNKVYDLGGGYGRLIPTLSQFSHHITLVEPSAKQRQVARRFLKGQPNLNITSGNIQRTTLPRTSADLVVLVRVLHHLPNPTPALLEIHRLLKPGGHLLLEFANSYHFMSRVKSLITGLPVSTAPIEKRSLANIRRHTIPFVNHYPQSILNTLSLCNFKPLRLLSVSNFRSPTVKRFIPPPILNYLESISQSPLAKVYFGPSIFILCKRVDKQSTP